MSRLEFQIEKADRLDVAMSNSKQTGLLAIFAHNRTIWFDPNRHVGWKLYARAIHYRGYLRPTRGIRQHY